MHSHHGKSTRFACYPSYAFPSKLDCARGKNRPMGSIDRLGFSVEKARCSPSWPGPELRYRHLLGFAMLLFLLFMTHGCQKCRFSTGGGPCICTACTSVLSYPRTVTRFLVSGYTCWYEPTQSEPKWHHCELNTKAIGTCAGGALPCRASA